MSVGLLDVYVLVALAWPSHIHHNATHEWFGANRSKGWATCPMTQCGFVRVSSNPAIIPEAVAPIEAIALLESAMKRPDHVFWPDSIPVHDNPVPSQLRAGHRQVTDAYLLGLAIHHQGRLVTLDLGVAAVLPADSPYRDAVELIPMMGD